MSLTTFKQNTKAAARAAMVATFQGESDNAGLAEKFAEQFANKFCGAIKTYLSTCIVLPVGGPVVPGPPTDLITSIQNAARAAMVATFQGESDNAGLAEKFAEQFAPVGQSIATYIATCTAIPGTPVTAGLTPGGPLICPPTTSIETILYSAARAAMVATFQGESDNAGLAEKFALKIKDIATHFHKYISTYVSTPGGGILVIT